MATEQKPPADPPATPEQLALPDLVVIHMITVLDVSKGWRTTVRIQDGWQGATLEHWSRGGASIPHGVSKVTDDLAVALQNALEYLPAF